MIMFGVSADYGNLLRTERRCRAYGPGAPGNQSCSSVYLHLVRDDCDLQFTIGKQLIYLVTGSHNETVIRNAANYLKFDTIFYFVTAVISVLRNAMQGLGETVIPLVSSALEMIGKVVIAVTLVPLLGYTGVIVAEPIVWVIMVIPLIVKILKMPELKKTV